MKRQIIITDLTRFNKPDLVCTAGIDYNTKECIRPLPYLTRSVCERLRILPGGILTGDFDFKSARGGPHTEDSVYTDLKFLGACTSEVFREVLESTCFKSIADGFEIDLPDGDRGVPHDHPLSRSIITIKADPETVSIDAGYKEGTLKLRFTDAAGKHHYNFPITDLGFHNFAQKHYGSGELKALNGWIKEQALVILRIGLSGLFEPPGQKRAFWMQANGVYTFPDAPPGIRQHV